MDIVTYEVEKLTDMIRHTNFDAMLNANEDLSSILVDNKIIIYYIPNKGDMALAQTTVNAKYLCTKPKTYNKNIIIFWDATGKCKASYKKREIIIDNLNLNKYIDKKYKNKTDIIYKKINK